MRKFSIPILAAAVAALIISLAPFGFAQAQRPLDRMTIVAIDRASLAGDQEAQDLVESALGLLIHLKSGKPFAFVFTDDLSNPVGGGPLDTDATAFRDVREAVYEGLAEPPLSEDALDVAGALAEIYNYMSGLNVGSTASVYLITGSAGERDISDEMANIGPVLNLIKESGWAVFNITAPGVNPDLATELNEVALDTGGRSFALSVPEGFETLADDTLRREGKGQLTKIGDTVLAGSAFTFQANVVPGTERLDLLFFRDESLTSFRLTNPDGRESTAGDRTSSTRIELPSAVIWEIVDPIPGAWIMEARAAAGRISGNMFIINRYRIQLQESPTVPVGQPHTIVAAVMDGDIRIPIPDANVSARVTNPDGVQVLYTLTDDGQSGDAGADDGFFSAILPVDSAGPYSVELRLFWDDIGYEITSLSSFQAQDFPQLRIEPVENIGIIPLGARTKIATVEVTVAEIPFPISPEDLTPAVGVNRGLPGEVELVPRRVIGGGKALSFDVYYTPAEESLANVTVNLQMEYGGSVFTQTTGSEAGQVSSVQPRPTPVPPTPAPTPEPAATTVPQPTPTPAPPDTRPRNAALIVAGAVAIIVIGALLYWVSRPTPFGYIYTEDGQPAANFHNLQRAAGANIFSRSVVTGEELGLDDFAGVTFEFQGSGQVALSVSAESGHDVRLNNQPVTEATQVFDNTLIGTLGRLYIFRTERQEDADAEDDA